MHRTNADKPQRLAYRVSDTCHAGGFGKSTLYKLAAEGRLELIRIRGRTLVTADSLHRLIDEARASREAA